VAIIADSEPLRRQLEGLQTSCLRKRVWALSICCLALPGCSSLLGAVGISRVQLLDSRQRQQMAEQQRQEAEAPGAGSQARQ
jgi:twitching motility protein PilJ